MIFLLIKKYMLVLLVLTSLLSCTQTKETNELKLDDQVDQVLNLAAGVYYNNSFKSSIFHKDIENLRVLLDKTIIITSSNFGYRNHLHNFKCFMDRLQFKFLVLSFDQKTHNHIESNMKNSGNIFSILATEGPHIFEESTTFRTPQFNIITNRKIEYVLQIMKKGFNVLFADIDIAVMQDPLPHVFWNNVDYVHSLNVICTRTEEWDFNNDEGNTGFYFVRSNQKTIKLFSAVHSAVKNFHGLDDQTIFWKVIRSSSKLIQSLKKCVHNTPSLQSLVICPLDTCQFSCCSFNEGMFNMSLLMPTLHNRSITTGPITMHANCLKGNRAKTNSLAERGLWLYQETGNCKEMKLALDVKLPVS